MELLLGHDHPSPEHNLQFRDPLILDILIHAIVSEILDLGRAIPSASSKAIDLLKRSDLTNGLARWKSYFDQMDVQSQQTEIARSALATYHLAGILRGRNIPATFAPCGTMSLGDWFKSFSPGVNDVSRAEQASPQIDREACIHAIHIIDLYLQESTSTKFQSFYQNRTAVIACLVLANYMSNLKQQNRSKAPPPETAELNTSNLLKLLGGKENLISGANYGLHQAAMVTATQLVTAVKSNIALHPGGMGRFTTHTWY